MKHDGRFAALAMMTVLLLVLGTPLFAQAQGKIPTPSEFLGFTVGADRTLADYKQIVSYFNTLASSSRRIEIENLGPTTLGNDMILAVISSEENLKNKRKYQEIAKQLADPRGLSESDIENLVREGKTILLISCGIHASEIGASQMSMEWAHSLVTAQDPETKRRLDNVFLLLAPSINPDGQIMEVEWYRKNLGTPYEGGRLPWLYHHYVGHDNNRDWYMLTQKETKALNRAIFFEWHPQIWLDEHQMGSTGPRIFVPPFANPVARKLHPIIWRGVDHIGTMMAWRLEQQKKAGVIYGYTFDAYWPGGTMNTAWWKNIFGLLTEVASVRLATPIEVAPTDLSGGGKGLIEYQKQTNFPNPWPGGVWRLRDIMDYERIASDAILEVSATYREDFLRGVVQMATDAMKSGKPGEYYAISLDQRDAPTAARLAHLLRENGAEVMFHPEQRTFYVPTTQPLADFLAEVLEPQRYPRVKMAAGPGILAPYDVTAWTLPLMMGVEVNRMTLSVESQRGLRPIAETDWPAGSADRSSINLYALSHQSNNAVRFVNDVLKQKGAVSLVRQPFELGGKTYPSGTFLIEVADPTPPAKKYSLALDPLPAKPSVAADKLREVRVGMYKPWVASMDEGWTRWVLEQHSFSQRSIDNKTMKTGKLPTEYDVIILPDVSKDVIVEGRRKPEEGQSRYFTELPPEYSGGIGKEGTKNLKEFVEKGGTVVALAAACDFVIEEFNIPLVNVLARVKSEEFNAPGAIVRMHLDPDHPVTYGMPDQIAGYMNERMAFQTSLPGTELSRKVLVWYPTESEDVLQSGWILGAERLTRRAAAVAFTYGKGKLVLFGFPVQHRAQTEGTFRLLFNALYWSVM